MSSVGSGAALMRRSNDLAYLAYSDHPVVITRNETDAIFCCKRVDQRLHEFPSDSEP